MNVSLTPELVEMVDYNVRAGRYKSRDHVIREALRRMKQQDSMLSLNKDVIERMIDEADEDIKAGRVCDGEEVFDELQAELRAAIEVNSR